MKETWNMRYQQQEFAYGKSANVFLEKQLMLLKPGKILLPAEGEGRNAVFAARQGWQVTAFDFSEEGSKKALAYADSVGVTINYEVCDAADFKTDQQFDALALIYTHFGSQQRKMLFTRFIQFLKPGGTLIMEVFSKNQLGRSSGGPKDLDLLYSVEEMQKLFPTIRFSYCKEELVELNEGPYHQGEAVVIRLTGWKEAGQ
ncbi:MAG: class I SAM-dependent methyltransferase [Cyclobacteriaceae bacterium]|nr:class I SAM-dependent methyltransferase [Cyclobacteriaceae bacterium]